jgi:hypothetical protein
MTDPKIETEPTENKVEATLKKLAAEHASIEEVLAHALKWVLDSQEEGVLTDEQAKVLIKIFMDRYALTRIATYEGERQFSEPFINEIKAAMAAQQDPHQHGRFRRH